MRNLTTIINKETCLFYGLPGTAILAVSLILSCKSVTTSEGVRL